MAAISPLGHFVSMRHYALNTGPKSAENGQSQNPPIWARPSHQSSEPDSKPENSVSGDSKLENSVSGDSKPAKSLPGDSKQHITQGHVKKNQNHQQAPSPAGPVTKQALLARAGTRAGRAWIHIKWPLLRNDRPFSADEISAFASWLVMGNVLWVLLGTTTFVLTAMYFVDAFGRAWGYVAGDDASGDSADGSFIGWLTGAVLTTGLGVSVAFKKGHVLPRLEDGMLKFQDLTVVSSEPAFEARIAELDVSLSFNKWYSGKGLIKDLAVFGMHVVQGTQEKGSKGFKGFKGFKKGKDKESSSFTEDIGSKGNGLIDPAYELQHIRIHDSRLDLYDDGTPTHIQVFTCDMPRLRGNKLLVDFFSASIVTGTVNNSMFSVHKNQAFSGQNSVKFELKGIDLAPLAARTSSKFNWIAAGKADLEAEIRMPDLQADESGSAIASFLRSCMAEYHGARPPVQDAADDADGLIKGAIVSLYETFKSEKKMDSSPYVVVNANVRFSELQARMPGRLPMTAQSVPFVSLQGLRSLITYVNETDSPVTIKTYGIEKVADLDGLTSLSQTKIYDSIVGDIYDDLLQKARLDERRILEEKAVHWSHTLMGQLFLIGLGVMA